VLGTAVIGTTVLTGLSKTWQDLGFFGTVAVVAASLVLNTGVCIVAFRVTTVRPLTVKQVLPGAMLAALLWQMLQWFGAAYVSHVVASASVTNSVFAIVLGLLAFLYLVSMALMLCAEINVVHVNGLHPRALLTPFVDNVDLTEADRKAYAGQAEAQRAKSFQQVAVSFDEPDQETEESTDAVAAKPVQESRRTIRGALLAAFGGGRSRVRPVQSH
jgi:membrane protein